LFQGKERSPKTQRTHAPCKTVGSSVKRSGSIIGSRISQTLRGGVENKSFIKAERIEKISEKKAYRGDWINKR